MTAYHAPCQSSSHESKPDEQEKARSPHSARVAIAIPFNPILVDEVDDEHAEEGADAWNPINELHMHGRRDLDVLGGRVSMGG